MVVLLSLAMRWWFAGFLSPVFPAPYANAEIPQKSVTTLALDQLRAEHQHELGPDEGRVRFSCVLRNGGHYFTDVLIE
jgi:hypothetical protein